ncbi:MAG: hypothetical protein ACI89X_001500 [Planctomycetota bacterium]|jgi:hypothetical protein
MWLHHGKGYTMKAILFSFLSCALAQPVLAQAQDIGLTMDGGVLTVLYGQDCGPVACTPFVGGSVAGGETRSLVHLSAPQTLYAIAIGNAGTCVAVPGFDNSLLLSNPFVLGWGLTSAPPFVGLPCQQGMAFEQLVIPAGVPAGIVFRVQSFGQSLSGQFGFGPTIEATTV